MSKKLINRIMTSKAVLIWAIVLFAIALYWVEFSPWGSHNLQQYNGGYGTFDMKAYDADIVYNVLNVMEPEGFKIYELYFIGDFLLIIGMGIVQIRLLAFVFRNFQNNIWAKYSIWVPIARGVFDAVENLMLIVVLVNYPSEIPILVTIAKISTFLKLKAIALWSLIFFAGIIIDILARGRKLYFNRTTK